MDKKHGRKNYPLNSSAVKHPHARNFVLGNGRKIKIVFQFPARKEGFMLALKKKPKQYFLAVVPPDPVYAEALKLKNYFREKYNSKASLNSPPHITLHMPFQWREEKEDDLVKVVSRFRSEVRPFTLRLADFGSFPPRVIFIDVAPSLELAKLQKDLLRFCKKELNLFNADYKNQPFHPHLTLAFRDLKKSIYAEAWQEFSQRKFEGQFLVDKFQLLKHNGKVWQSFHEISL